MSNELPLKTLPLVVVTGSSHGIGRAIAEHLANHGWMVQGVDLVAPSWSHPHFSAALADLTDRGAIERFAVGVTHADALVHAAGVLRVGTLGALNAQDGECMWRLHADCAAALADKLIPAMAARAHGRVVLIGSRVSHGMPGRSQYAATKAALVALARSWAAEVASRGVTVNIVSPAATQTSMLSDPARAGSAPRVPPIGRLIQPQEIAGLVAFLLSPAAAAITGQDIAICGGASLPH